MTPKPLTDTQRNILNWIIWFKQINGYPPSRTEIANEFKFSSPNSAQYQLEQLQKKGAIFIVKKIARGIIINQERKNGE